MNLLIVASLVLIALLIVLFGGLVVVISTDFSRMRRLNIFAMLTLMVGTMAYYVWVYLYGGAW